MDLKKITLNYFKEFSEKNISSLEKYFAKDIVLKDWEIAEFGIDSVIKANNNIFNNVDNIFVEPLNLYREDNTVISELKIVINNSEILNVLELIEFNEDKKIKRIFAYKRN